MRERVGHGEVGRRNEGDEGVRPRPGGGVSGGGVPGGGRWLEPGVGWRVGRPRARGPRPVRPGRPVVAARPPEVARPIGWPARSLDGRWADGGPRVLVRRSALRCGARFRVRRAVAGLALVVASAAVVVALGLLARVAEPVGVPDARSAAVELREGGPVVVTAEPGETVWEVVSRVAPELSGPRRAALAERIAVDNALTSVRLRPGQVLRVAAG